MATKKILIVDDEPDMQRVYKAALEKEGYTILLAANAKDALVVAQEQHPDLMLVDMSMPETGGHEVQQQLRASEGTAHIPVVFLSAFSSAASRARDNEAFAKEVGALGFIRKGIGLDEFVEHVRRYLAA